MDYASFLHDVMDVDQLEDVSKLFQITGCRLRLTSKLNDVSCVSHIRHLSVSSYWGQSLCDVLEHCEHLEELDVYASNMRIFPQLPCVDRLTRLIMDSPVLCDVSSIGNLYCLRELVLAGGIVLHDIQGVDACVNLEDLFIKSDCIQDIGPVGKCVNLKQLKLRNCYKVQDISPLANCKQLTSVEFSWMNMLQDLSALTELKCLRELNLCSCNVLVDVAFIGYCTALEVLFLTDTYQMEDLTSIGCCTELTHLFIKNSDVEDLRPLTNCQKLKMVNLNECARVKDISPLAHLVALEGVYLDECTSLEDISPLAHCAELNRASMNYINCLRDLSPLANCKKLRRLSLECIPSMHRVDLSVLDGLPNLNIKM